MRDRVTAELARREKDRVELEAAKAEARAAVLRDLVRLFGPDTRGSRADAEMLASAGIGTASA